MQNTQRYMIAFPPSKQANAQGGRNKIIFNPPPRMLARITRERWNIEFYKLPTAIEVRGRRGNTKTTPEHLTQHSTKIEADVFAQFDLRLEQR